MSGDWVAPVSRRSGGSRGWMGTTMSLDDSEEKGKTNNDVAGLQFEFNPSPGDRVTVGSRWEGRTPRADGSRRVVTVVGLDAINVDFLDDRGEHGACQTLFLPRGYKCVSQSSQGTTSSAEATPEERAAMAELLAAIRPARVEGAVSTRISFEMSKPLASALLKRNLTNRSVDIPAVIKYARDMKNGQWCPEHSQGFALGPDLELGDGQHRCEAAKASGVRFRAYFTQYHDRKIFDAVRMTCDKGKKRTTGNVLEMLGHVPRGKGNTTAAALVAVTFVDDRYPSNLSSSDIVDMFLKLKASIAAVEELSPKRFTAPVRAAFIIAHTKCPAEIGTCIHSVAANDAREGTAANALITALPGLQKAKGSVGRPELIGHVLSFLYKHVKGATGVASAPLNRDALRFFLGPHEDDGFRNLAGKLRKTSKPTQGEL